MSAVRAFGLAAVLLWVAPSVGSATEWRVAVDHSRVAFTYGMNGAPASGAFVEMDGRGVFDPADPGASRFELRIPTRGLDLGNPLFSAFAQSAEWFDAANHPEIVYRLAALRPLGDGAWEALGDITVKGRLIVMRTPIALTVEKARARAVGALAFDPGAVGLGQGPSALLVRLDPEVVVTFDLVAHPDGSGDAP